MDQAFVDDYLKRIFQLEQLIGAKTTYQILEPFYVNTQDIISIQDAAKKIGEFIGLKGLTFIVAACKQEENIAGHIESNKYENIAFVEVSTENLKYEQATLAVLAHEVTHKYLDWYDFYSKIGCQNEYEKEILTDITSVFLGLGKLLLNGYEIDNTDKIKKFGYLNLLQLAFLYRLICAMRKILSDEYERNLNKRGIEILQYCDRNYSFYFDNRFHDSKIREEVCSKIREVQSVLDKVEKNLSFCKEIGINFFNSYLDKTHKKIYQIQIKANNMESSINLDPALQFLNAIKASQTTGNLISELTKLSYEAKQNENYLIELAKFITELSNQLPKPDPKMYTNIICRNCGMELRIPISDKTLIVTCPNSKCKYSFLASTSIPVFSASAKIKKVSKWKKVCKSLFRKN